MQPVPPWLYPSVLISLHPHPGILGQTIFSGLRSGCPPDLHGFCVVLVLVAACLEDERRCWYFGCVGHVSHIKNSAGDHDGKVENPLSAKQMGGLAVSVRVVTEKGSETP